MDHTPDTDPTPEPVRQPWTPPTLRELEAKRATRSGVDPSFNESLALWYVPLTSV